MFARVTGGMSLVDGGRWLPDIAVWAVCGSMPVRTMGGWSSVDMAVHVSTTTTTMLQGGSQEWFARRHGGPTIVVLLLPQRSHASFECRIQRSSHRVYRARRGPATWLI